MSDVWIQITITAGSIITAGFGLFKYAIGENKKMQKELYNHTQKTQEMMLEYFEQKNGHIERISNEFSTSNKKMASAVSKLATELRVLTEKK